MKDEGKSRSAPLPEPGLERRRQALRKMEAYVAAHEGAMFFHRQIYLNGSLCPTLLEYGIPMRDHTLWWASFSNVPDVSVNQRLYGRKGQPICKVPLSFVHEVMARALTLFDVSA